MFGKGERQSNKSSRRRYIEFIRVKINYFIKKILERDKIWENRYCSRILGRIV